MIRMLPLMEAVQHGCQAAPPPSLVSPCSRHLGRRGGELIRDKSSSASPSPPAQINEEYTNRPEGRELRVPSLGCTSSPSGKSRAMWAMGVWAGYL
ncbi:hypothetical protein SRHO_G00169390 [Serrasalmus rhombeus]